MNKNYINFTFLSVLLSALISDVNNSTTLKGKLMNAHLRFSRLGFRSMTSVILIAILSITLLLSVVPFEAHAAGGSYDLKWYAADPTVNNAPYLPTYAKITPAFAPLANGTVGRQADPLKDAVAFGPTSSTRDALTSLGPASLALGQIVPFEMVIKVTGSTAPENGTIQFTTNFAANTTSGDAFGYDPTYKVYAAFVDTADAGTIDPGNNSKVNNFTSTVINPGTSNEAIQGTFNVSGLDNGDQVVVEIWVVLDSTITPGTNGNVQTSVDSARTDFIPPETIRVGNQVVQLSNVRDFFTSNADVSVVKIDSPDPVIQGQILNYSLVVKNNDLSTIANGINVTDTLASNTTFVSATGANYTINGSNITFNVGALGQNQTVTINISTIVSNTAWANNDTSTNSESGTPGPKPTLFDLLNIVSETAITSDSNTTNNTYYQPTNVLPANPTLTIKKIASPTNYSTVGQNITYTYNVTNSGNVGIAGPINVTDNITGIIQISASGLAPGHSITGTANYTIIQADLDNGSVTNAAFATGRFGNNTVTSNTANATVTANQNPALLTVKIASPTNYSTVGQNITYTYNVTNSGNVGIAGPINVTDNKTGIIQISASGLAPGHSITGTANYTITQADLDNGSVTNAAFVTGRFGNNTVTSNTANATVTANQNPALLTVKIASPTNYSTVGQNITYTYNVTNSGNVGIAGPINVTDNKTGIIQISASGLAPGHSITGTANYTITQADLDNGSVTNAAFATGRFGNNTVTSNTANATVTANQNPALLTVKIASPTNYSTVGQNITYTYNVTNSGNVGIAGPINVTDNITGIIQISASGLAPGHSITGTANYTITQADLDNGSVTNAAFATGRFGNNTVTSNTANATVTANQNPALLTVKIASPTNYSTVGQNITYTYNVTNSGNVGIAGPINVTDNKTGIIQISASGLAPGHSITGTANYTITQADLDNGSVTNAAFATGRFGNNTVTSNTANATVTANQNPALLTVKIASPTNYSTVGQNITYTYNVTNSGNVGIAGPINVTDNITGIIQISASGLAPGHSITGTANYTITQADLDNGSVTNAAFATGRFGNNTVTSNTANATVTANQNPALLTVKIASPTNYSTVGQNITYTYNVTNSGNVGIAGPINVTDNKTGIIQISASGLAPGHSITGTANYTITQADLDNGSVTNAAFATGRFGNNTVTSNTANATVTANQNPALLTVKIASPTNYSTVGQNITYTYNVTNSGNVGIAGPINVTDNITGIIQISASGLAPGHSITGTANYTITQADLDNGSVTNAAFATGRFGNNTVTSNTANATVTANQNPALLTVKIASPTNYSTVGQNITYTYNVTNSGNVGIAGPINVTDNKTGIIQISASGLAPGHSITGIANYTITQTDLDNGSVTNAAFVTGRFGNNTVTSNTANATVTANQNPALLTVKIASPTNYSTVGQNITYTYNVTNSGNVGIAGPINVTDNKTGIIQISASGLAPGHSITGTANYTITQADLDNGSVTNAAFATGRFGNNTVTSNTANATVTANQNPALLTVKIASPTNYSTVGQNITYTYNVTNSGNVGIAGPINVTDNITGIIQISASGLAPGHSITGTANYTITQADLDNGSVTNAAFATGRFGNNTVTSNTANATVTANQNPALLTVKIASPTNYSTVGQNITYTYNVTNSGNVGIAGPINVTDNITGIIQISASGLAPGHSITGTANYTITQADLDNGSVTNAAFATGRFGNNTVTSNTANATVTANQNPALLTVKIASPTNYSTVGQNITYTYNVTNSGNVGIAGPINVTDNITGIIQISASGLAPGHSITGTANYTITQADLDNGSVTNAAFATGRFGNNTVTSNTANATVTANQNPALLTVKIASPTNYSTVGQNITYTYNVTNSGNVGIAGPINVTDNITGIIQISASGLAPGHSITGTANYTITQADLDNGSVTNAAFATGRFGNNTVTSNTANATVTANQNPALLTVKIASPTNYSTVGQNITYTYNVTNSGNVGIAGPINVTDNKTGIIQISASGLAPGHSITGTANYTITQADLDNGSVTNAAFATGRFGNNTVTSNTANATVTANQNPALLTVKIASPTNYSTVGQNITYTYNVTNSGNVGIAGPINVTDNKTGIIQISASGLAPGHSITGTANYTITQADLDNGSVTNAAFATGRFGNNTVTSNTANATVTANQNPALLTVKIASPTNYSTVGQNITYTYIVTNSGNVEIGGPINVTDDKIGTFTISNRGVAPGQTVVGTANYTITQADLETCNDNATPINDSDDSDHSDHSNDNATPEVPLESSTDLDNSDNLYGCDHSYDCDDSNHSDHSNDNATPICSVTNAAFATGTFGNNTITSNTANATVTTIQCPECPHCPDYPDDCDDSAHPDHPNYSIFKSVIGSDEDEKCIVNSPGDKILYRIVVKNEGNVDLTGISVEDSMISLTGPIGDDTDPEVLNSGEAWVYTGIYTLTSDDINNGKSHIDNTATVSSNELPDKSSSVSQPIEEKENFNSDDSDESDDFDNSNESDESDDSDNSNDSDESDDLDASSIVVNTEPGLPIADDRESSHHGEETGHAVVVSSSEVSSSTATETGIQPAVGNKTPLAVNDTQNKSDGSTVANIDQTAGKKGNTSTPSKERKSTPGFEIVCGMTAVLAVYLYKRK